MKEKNKDRFRFACQKVVALLLLSLYRSEDKNALNEIMEKYLWNNMENIGKYSSIKWLPKKLKIDKMISHPKHNVFVTIKWNNWWSISFKLNRFLHAMMHFYRLVFFICYFLFSKQKKIFVSKNTKLDFQNEIAWTNSCSNLWYLKCC